MHLKAKKEGIAIANKETNRARRDYGGDGVSQWDLVTSREMEGCGGWEGWRVRGGVTSAYTHIRTRTHTRR